MRSFAILFFSACIFYACSPISSSRLTKTLKHTETEFQDHTGFMLYDVVSGKEVFAYHADRYFTPASNTKIFTLYAGLKILGDSVPALKYTVSGDSMIIWGTGDPSFLYDQVYQNNRVYDFLKGQNATLYFSTSNFHTEHFGPGWAWDDYYYDFSSERSSFPIYGNALKVSQTDNGYLRIKPSLFKKDLWLADSISKLSTFVREVGTNHIDYFPGTIKSDSEKSIPFRCDPLLIAQLLSDTLKRPVRFTKSQFTAEAKTIYSIPVDSVYKVMMQESDNFIAEQVLLMCAGELSDSLQTDIAIREVKKQFLSDMPDKLNWVDGSGLSRYNLFTPRSVVSLWKKIYTTIPRDRLFSILAAGGNRGTIRNYFKSQNPFIYGKTGTLSNNHCLSGFLIAKSGRILIFSFMSNNYTVPVVRIRKRMEEILTNIYEHY